MSTFASDPRGVVNFVSEKLRLAENPFEAAVLPTKFGEAVVSACGNSWLEFGVQGRATLHRIYDIGENSTPRLQSYGEGVPQFSELWAEVRQLLESGVRVDQEK